MGIFKKQGLIKTEFRNVMEVFIICSVVNIIFVLLIFDRLENYLLRLIQSLELKENCLNVEIVGNWLGLIF